eukprot:4292917-Alexandrium_andersonii.AAC.1
MSASLVGSEMCIRDRPAQVSPREREGEQRKKKRPEQDGAEVPGSDRLSASQCWGSRLPF